MKKILTFLFVFATINLFAQRTITGTVTDEKGETVVGAAVRILGTSVGTTTDTEGRYSIDVGEKDAFLAFSFAGMIPVNVKLESVNTINPVLKTTTLPTLEVIGYNRLACNRCCCHLDQSIIGRCCCLCGYVTYLTPPRALYKTYTDQSILTLNVLGNPFKDRFILDIKSEKEANIELSLHGINGKLVKSFETLLSKGDNRIEITDLAHLIAGTYAVSVRLLAQNDAPEVIDKQMTLDLPYKLYNKIMSSHPELQKDRLKDVIPLSKQQYELLFRANSLRENIGKVKEIILSNNPEFDSWDLDKDAFVLEADEILYFTHKEELTQLLNEYQAIMKSPLFDSKINENEYSLEVFVDKPYLSFSNILLVKREVVLKKKIYTQLVVKM